MARPLTRKVKLKSGYYIEVSKGSNQGIKIHRDTLVQIEKAKEHYLHSNFEVNYLGKVENGEFVK